MATNFTDPNETAEWILSHRKLFLLSLEYRTVKLGEKSQASLDKLKALPDYQRLSPSTLELIENLGNDFSKRDRVMMDNFQELLTLEKTNAIALQNFLAQTGHDTINKILRDQKDQIEKNRKKGDLWSRWVSDPAELISSFLHLGEDLPPPINFILKPLRIGFSYISYLADLKAMEYNPDLKGPQSFAEKGAKVGLVAAGSAMVGALALLAGGAAVGVAVAPIALFVGTAGLCLSSLINTGSYLVTLVKEWEPKEGEKSPWPRRIGMMSNVLTSAAGAAFTAVLGVAAFIAIANPIGLAVAGGLLATWALVTAGIALFGFVTKKIAEREASKQLSSSKEDKDEEKITDADKAKLGEDKKLKSNLNQVEKAYKDEVAEVATSDKKGSAFVPDKELHQHDDPLSVAKKPPSPSATEVEPPHSPHVGPGHSQDE